MKKWITMFLVCIMLLTVTAFAEDMEGTLRVGAGIRDISPTIESGVLPFTTYRANGDMTSVVKEVNDPLCVRVLAIEDNDETILMLGYDFGGITDTQVVKTIAEHSGVAEDSIFIYGTSNHSSLLGITSKSDVSTEDGKREHLFYELAMKGTLEAVDEALASLQPAKMSVGYTESDVNVNREARYYVEKDGENPYWLGALGFNSMGESDKTLSVVRFDALDGSPIGFVVNYGMFMVTMMNNTAGTDASQVLSADVAGFVSSNLEKKYEGSVALFTLASSGDQYPIVQTVLQYPDPETGEPKLDTLTGDVSRSILNYVGSILYQDTLRAVREAEDATGDAGISYVKGFKSIPGRKYKQGTAINSLIGKHNYEYSEGADVVLELAVLRIGDVTFVNFPGLLYASVGNALKEETLAENMILMTKYTSVSGESYTKSIVNDECLLADGGSYYGDKSNLVAGHAQDALIGLMNELIGKIEK